MQLWSAASLVALLATTVLGDFTATTFGVGCDLGDYPAPAKSCGTPSYAYTIQDNTGSFVILRFRNFNLAPTDYVLLRSLDVNSTTPKLKLSGRKYHGRFDAPPFSATGVAVELYTHASSIWTNTTAALAFDAASSTDTTTTCQGFQVEGYISALLPPSSITPNNNGTNETACGGLDRSIESPCYKYSPVMYYRSKAVARLLVNKGGVYTGCTGWLLGSEGHLLTNSDCIANQAEAAATRFEFMAEAPACPSKMGDIVCNKQLACRGYVWPGTARFVTSNPDLHYTLVQLDKSVVAAYSYLKLRATPGPVATEAIYIVQHQQAWGKRISDKTIQGKAVIEYTTATGDAAYLLDTQPMSGGAPILSANDHTVVALHYGNTKACPNFGVMSNRLASDLVARNAMPANGAA
ncbi:Aste57867_18302 [Aphanomyces stellatus]|uniref:Aste57867_18302 protein n=1 Tax=Aphanomyces stellatus TaxID=120398 RepID=A0A485LBC1_9STRA|nr:hypothetical protein As57867_018240 [Aphanomyces stellatus]VFT95038.1 Aste57867_18302 [Aphanomyces stellatus]